MPKIVQIFQSTASSSRVAAWSVSGAVAALCLLNSSHVSARSSISEEPLPPSYVVTKIASEVTGPLAINKDGDVVGTRDNPRHVPTGFLYRNGSITDLVFDGARKPTVYPIAVNDHDEVLVSRKNDGINPWIHWQVAVEPLIWQDGKFTAINEMPTERVPEGTIPPHIEDICAYGINNSGDIIGAWIQSPQGTDMPTTSHPFLWHDGRITPITDHASDGSPRDEAFEPGAINERGDVVGSENFYSMTPFTSPKGSAIYWSKGKIRRIFLKVKSGREQVPIGFRDQLSEFTMQVLNPKALNKRGNWVGSAGPPAFGERACRSSDKEDTVIALDDPPADSSTSQPSTGPAIRSCALGINDRDEIVGTTGGPKGRGVPERAVLWQDGNAYDLNKLIGPNPGVHLETAYAINASGQIVAVGDCNAYLLTPAKR